MGTPIASPEFVRLLDDRLREVTEDVYNELPKMIPQLFGIVNSDSAWEEYGDVGAVPDLPEFNGELEYLPVAMGFLKLIEPKEYAGGIQVQRKFIEDNRYDVLENWAKKMMVAGVRTQEKAGADAFNNAFSTAYDFMTVNEEGVALCSNSHTTKSGVSTSSGFDNLGTGALSKTSVAANRLLMKKFKNDIGERIDIGDNLALIVPLELEDTALEIVGTPKGLNTTDGTINPQAGRFQVIPYLRLDDNDTNNWFLTDMDKQKDSLLWINRVPLAHEVTADWGTYNMLQKMRGRWGYGFIDWRWIFGAQVS